MLAVGGLKAAAKRTAFGDVSNTAKNLSARDDTAVTGKPTSMAPVKPVAPQENLAAFLRPAQRPLNAAGPKAPVNAQLVPTSLEPVSKAPQHVQLHKRTLSKPSTAIYIDSAVDQPPQPAMQNHALVPAAPAQSSVAPRHYKSQPYLKTIQPALPLSQNKSVKVEPVAKPILSDPIYEDAPEEQRSQSPKDSSEANNIVADKEAAIIHEVSKAAQVAVEKALKKLPPPPSVSEPEEYWEEEEEEEIYDEQGYTTAHSYRSRGDTTGGVTTVLLPKFTNKVKRELAEAKELVEATRSSDDIDDEAWDTSMVAEYGDEIFAYMRELEVSLLRSILLLLPVHPSPNRVP
jgi:G2/mitotic-specific cyclin 3/4